MYYFYVSYVDGPKLYVLESALHQMLVQRLLTYVPAQDSGLLIGSTAFLNLLPGISPLPMFGRLSLFVEPGKFAKDKTGMMWSLLTRDEAVDLYLDWCRDPRYSEDLGGKPNYFKNSVDYFKTQLEARWSQQQKLDGASTSNTQGRSTAASSATRSRKIRRRPI